MARLTYSMLGSLDGLFLDAEGRFDWAEPSLEEMAFVNDREASTGTALYGRRMYEVMHVWETDPSLSGQAPGQDPDDVPEEVRAFARLWQAQDKIVYSTTLPEVRTERTQLRRTFDVEEVRTLKEQATAGLSISGPELAGHAFAAGLVDEVQLYLVPHIIGTGRSLFPTTRVDLELVEERRFASGTVFLQYAVRSPSRAD